MFLMPKHPMLRHASRSACRSAIGIVSVMLLPGLALAVNVSINATNTLSPVAGTALGLHTSVYDNINGSLALGGFIKESGVTTLRYPGGGYADIFHWSASKPGLGSANGYGLTPWWGQAGNYGYMGSSTDFGSFVQLLTNASAQAIITVDYGSGLQWNAGHTQVIAPTTNGQPQEAAAWVAYANANTNIFGTVNDVTIGVDALGNNWQTAGYWAMMRAAKPLGTDDGYNFLRINHFTPVKIKYWEIGNETFGTGYYGGGDGYSVNYAVPYDGTTRSGNASLSPAFYGQKVNAFAQAMKAVDPTIKIGTVVTTPPGDYSSDSFNGQHWTPQVLAQCAASTDFVIAHWYPDVTAGANYADYIGSNLLSDAGSTIPFMINGATAGLDSGTSSGLRDWINAYRPDGTNVQIFITEFGYMGSVSNSILGPVNALFTSDCYATWMDFGVSNVDYLEMNKAAYLGDNGSALARGAAFFGVKLVHLLASPGDSMLATASDHSSLRAHAVARQDGRMGLLLINEDPTNSQAVNVAFTNVSIAGSGVQYQFGMSNFTSGNIVPLSAPSSNTVAGLGNSFAVTVPAYTMIEWIIPILTNTPPVLAAIGNQTVNVGQTIAFTASATDTDLPPQTLTFNLPVAPANATLNSGSGAFSWRPVVSQSGTTNVISLAVSDNGMPSLSATQSFTIIVNPLVPPVLSAAGWSSGQFALQVGGQTGPDYAVEVSTNLSAWSTLFITNSPTMPFQWADTNAAGSPVKFYRVKAGPPLP
jgi:hypothetical protein